MICIEIMQIPGLKSNSAVEWQSVCSLIAVNVQSVSLCGDRLPGDGVGRVRNPLPVALECLSVALLANDWHLARLNHRLDGCPMKW